MEFGKLLVGMQRVPVAAQGADVNALFLELLFELLDLGRLAQPVELEVWVADVITCPQLNRSDPKRLNLLDNLVQAELGEQGREEPYLHRVSPPRGTRGAASADDVWPATGPRGCRSIVEFHLKRR